MQRGRCAVLEYLGIAPLQADLEEPSRVRLVRNRSASDLRRPEHRPDERRRARVGLAVQRVRALHSRTSLRPAVLMRGLTLVLGIYLFILVFQVPSIGGGAGGVAYGARSRRMDVLV